MHEAIAECRLDFGNAPLLFCLSFSTEFLPGFTVLAGLYSFGRSKPKMPPPYKYIELGATFNLLSLFNVCLTLQGWEEN
jgi:hypothetical protein